MPSPWDMSQPMAAGGASPGGAEPGTPGLGALLKALETQTRRRSDEALLRRMLRRLAMCVVGVVLVAWLWQSAHRNHDVEVHCFFLIDRSGSMNSMRTAVVSGFNEYVVTQTEQPGTMKLTLAQFNSNNPLELLLEARDIHTVPRLRLKEFSPRGSTPLYDALALLIDHAAKQAALKTSEVVIVVFTDGGENASKRFSREQVLAKAAAPTPNLAPLAPAARRASSAPPPPHHRHRRPRQVKAQQQQHGWTFVFLGANQDSCVPC